MCMALQGEMYGLRNVFTSSKGPGKDLLETLLPDSGSIFFQSRISFEDSSVRSGYDLDGF